MTTLIIIIKKTLVFLEREKGSERKREKRKKERKKERVKER